MGRRNSIAGRGKGYIDFNSIIKMTKKNTGFQKKPEKDKKVDKSGLKDTKERRRDKDGSLRKKAVHKADNFSGAIFKVLKQVRPDTGITAKSMSVINSFCIDIFDRLAREAAKLGKRPRDEGRKKLSYITSRDIQTAARLVLPGELAKHAVSEGTKAVTKYTASKE